MWLGHKLGMGTMAPVMTRHLLIVSTLVSPKLLFGQSETLARAQSGVDDGAASCIAQFEPGAVVVTVKADDPGTPEIAWDAVADLKSNEVAVDGERSLRDYHGLSFVAVETDDLASQLAMPGVLGWPAALD